jgi:hypothetical protein
MSTKNYKYIATMGPKHGATVGVGFFLKKEAERFVRKENRRWNNGYYVQKVSEVVHPKFI